MSARTAMTLEEARRIVRAIDLHDLARGITAVAAVMRWEASYSGDDGTLGPVADYLERVAEAMAPQVPDTTGHE